MTSLDQKTEEILSDMTVRKRVYLQLLSARV